MNSFNRTKLALAAAVALVVAFGVASSSRVHAAGDAANVILKADHLGPRPIEDLTRKSVARDYGNAWSSMSQALSKNEPDLLNAYFTGFAKDNLTQMVADQQRTGVRVVYHDLSHHLDALFYSPAGDAMQLRDSASVEIEIRDGDKTVSREQANLEYMVLMTPGADRWLVRDLEGVPTKH
jgi:hypothetical protein